MTEDDFSMEWFGIPDAKVVALWKKLSQLPPPIQHRLDASECYCGGCKHERIKRHYKRLAELGLPPPPYPPQNHP